jgi:hypothetical protein
MREELIRWRDGSLPDERDRIVAHLASCQTCAATYAELVRTPPAELRPMRFDPADFVERGYAARKTSRPGWSAVTAWKGWTLGLSAAAAIVLVVVLGLPQLGTDPDATRGSTIEIQSTESPSDRLFVVEWQSALAASRYRVELFENQRVLYTTLTDARRVMLPADVAAALQEGRVYTWKVTALDSQGADVTASSKTLTVGASPR